jgi:hypothetical protein
VRHSIWGCLLRSKRRPLRSTLRAALVFARNRRRLEKPKVDGGLSGKYDTGTFYGTCRLLMQEKNLNKEYYYED